MANFLEFDTISLSLVVTDDMFPLHNDIIIRHNSGEIVIMPTNTDGEVLDVIKGNHMKVEMTAGILIEWMGSKPFWSEQPYGKGQFKMMSLKHTENDNA